MQIHHFIHLNETVAGMRHCHFFLIRRMRYVQQYMVVKKDNCFVAMLSWSNFHLNYGSSSCASAGVITIDIRLTSMLFIVPWICCSWRFENPRLKGQEILKAEWKESSPQGQFKHPFPLVGLPVDLCFGVVVFCVSGSLTGTCPHRFSCYHWLIKVDMATLCLYSQSIKRNM